MRKIGHTQLMLLSCLVEYGSWHDRARWRWEGIASTKRMLDRLVARGLVDAKPVMPARYSVTDGKTPLLRYTINRAGRRELKKAN